MKTLLAYLALVYAVSWICFTTAPLGSPVFLLGVFAPSLVAIALTFAAHGRDGVVALLRPIAIVPAAWRWYAFAIGYMAAIKLSVALLIRIAAGAWPAFGDTPVYLMAGALVLSTPVQAGEEIGWRAFVLPRLAVRVGLPLASVVVGAIWACWHLPLFYRPGADTFHQSFPVYFAGVTAISVAMAWLYWRTGESLVATMLMHAAVNNTKDIVPSAGLVAPGVFALDASPAALGAVALLWGCAAWFLVRMRGERLSQGSERTVVAEPARPV